eukprot:CAMPEP_0183357656 /NCGR_PEP_ID=MMETSP0164_2-20130417/46940_1 /TAXON_ID=221442 /ORGANISM="Coccolithus pelagicus ssp braarudi, Strain PLY182g" /LENGTH=40 /DNA_ID= /DNA_START= /DNA_END= /DNA_ORIENTATION=
MAQLRPRTPSGVEYGQERRRHSSLRMVPDGPHPLAFPLQR